MAGNLINDGVPAYTFDAENKIKKVDSVTAYTNDGSGQRVRKLAGENTRFIYGIGGQLVAEFDLSSGSLKKEYVPGGASLITIEPTAVNSNGTRYATADHLGSPRVLTNSSAGVVSRHDYKAFGEELGVGVGGRTTGMGFSVTDNTRQKFTGQERDTETGLDYFDARYYPNTQGRFTSVDPLAASASAKNPQTFNRYTYALNSPYRFNDPSGMMAEGYAAPTGSGAVSMSGFDEFSLLDTEVSGYSLDDPTEAAETPSAAETPQNTSFVDSNSACSIEVTSC